MRTNPLDWTALCETAATAESLGYAGRVEEMVGLVIKSRGPHAPVGAVCHLEMPPPHPAIPAEIVGFRQNQVLLMPHGEVRGLKPRTRVVLRDHQALAPVGDTLLGRVIDGLGRPLDGKGPLERLESRPL